MNDVHALAPQHWQWNGWLNPKGRVIALFALIALDADRYWLLLPDMPAVELIARLQRFVFRSKVKLGARDDCTVLGAFALPRAATGSGIHRDASEDKEIVELDFSASGGPRTLRIATNSPRVGEMASVIAEQRWATFDLAHGLPHLGADQVESWTPQMLSLERLHAFSLKKGCYPGQEIVARTHYLGHAKRGLARIGGHALTVGNEISADGRVLGSIVCSIGDEALAVLVVDRPAMGLECAGVPCSEFALLDGLAR